MARRSVPHKPPPVPVAAATVGTLSKMYATEVAQRLANTAVNALGLGGMLDLGSYRAAMDGLPAFTHLLMLHWTISAGTNEIQRNIMAQRGLGLPRG